MNVTRPILLRECNYLQVGVNYRLESESESLFDCLSQSASLASFAFLSSGHSLLVLS